jgi:hypothetical protein
MSVESGLVRSRRPSRIHRCECSTVNGQQMDACSVAVHGSELERRAATAVAGVDRRAVPDEEARAVDVSGRGGTM